MAGIILQGFGIGGVIPPPPISFGGQSTVFNELFTSTIAFLYSTGIFGPQSIDFTIDPDSIERWPVNPPPYAILIPGRIANDGNDLGAGRFGKVWSIDLQICIVVLNTYDVSFKDTVLMTSMDESTGPYEIAQNLINLFEQGYVTYVSTGRVQVVEFPRGITVDEIKRFKNSNEYVYLPVTFSFTMWERLPAPLP